MNEFLSHAKRQKAQQHPAIRDKNQQQHFNRWTNFIWHMNGINGKEDGYNNAITQMQISDDRKILV
jgi:hypothetical protein